MQRFVVAPNEQVRETPYIEHNIAATRKAFALDKVEERELSGDALLTRADIDANDATLDNVRLWDHQPLLETFAQIQEIRTYYDFVSVDNDRYMIDGEYRQVMLSARELNSESLPNRNWINERLTFTHGYGLTLGPVNQVTPEGPAGPVHQGPAAAVLGRPADRGAEHLLRRAVERLRLRQDEGARVPLPEGRRQRLHDLRGHRRRPGLELLPAAAVQHPVPVVQDAAERRHHHREPGDVPPARCPSASRESRRSSATTPTRTCVISDGRLFWIQDAYTTSDRYPYSTPAADGINYIRNSVKATVDAYHGTVALLPDRRHGSDRADACSASFPTLFRPLSEMPADMRTRLRYPEGIFALQAAMYATYHMTNPAVFYNKEDQWEVPAIDSRAAVHSRCSRTTRS